MPNIESILETMQKQGISEKTISKFTLPKTKKATPNEIIEFINQMDNLLPKEQRLSIMEEQGCYKTDVISAKFREFGTKYSDKTIKEKIELLDKLVTKFKVPCQLNKDGTITIYFPEETNGNYKCKCPTVNKLISLNIPLTYCGCCAGHLRYTYQYALGAKLRLKKIVSSIINSNGEKPCKFIFEIDN